MTRIAIDAMGGDRAPDEIVAGALEAASPQITPVLVGPAGLPALAIHVDNHEMAVQTLEAQGFVVFCENDLDDATGI